MRYARIYPWRRTRRSRAPSNQSEAFFVAQFSAGYTTNMFGFDLRQGQAFARAKYFAINVLTADQRELSQRFSSTVADKFDGVGAVSGHGGIPLINGCAFDRANVRLGSN